MPVQFSCPECDKVLKSANPIAPGKKVKCPGCGTVFSPTPAKPAPKKPADDEETVELKKTKPAPAKAPAKPAPFDDDEDFDDPDAAPKPKAAPKKPAIEDDEEEDEEEAAPPPKKAVPPARKPAALFQDEDEEEAPKPAARKAPPKRPADFEDDDDDDAPPPPKGKKAPPPVKKGRMVDDDDEDEDEEDERPRKGKGKKQKSSAGLLIALALILVLLGLGAVGAFIWPGFLKESTPIAKKGGPGPDGKTPTPIKTEPDIYSLIPADSVVIFGANLGSARDSKTLGATIAKAQASVGIDAKDPKAKEIVELINKIDKAIVVQIPGAGKAGLAAVNFTSDVDLGKIKEVLAGKDVPGKPIIQTGMGLVTSVTPKLFVFSDLPVTELEKRTKEPSGSLSDDVQSQMDKVKDALVWIVIPNSPMMQAGLDAMSKDLPPDPGLKDAVQAAKTLKAASIEVREDGSGLVFKARVECASPKDATALQAAVSNTVKTLVPFLLAGMEKKGDMPPELTKTIRSIVASFNSGTTGTEAWATITLTNENLRTIEAIALMYFGKATVSEK